VSMKFAGMVVECSFGFLSFQGVQLISICVGLYGIGGCQKVIMEEAHLPFRTMEWSG